MKKKQFKKIYIEITNICNLSCSFCPSDNRKKEMMTKDNFKYIISQVKEYTDYIYLHVKGEPLIHPDINKLIDIAYNEGLSVNITTNGTNIDKLQNKKIRQINYSMQSTRDILEMEEIIKKLRRFILDTNIYLSLRLWSEESKKNEDIIKLLKKEFNIEKEIADKMTIDKNVFLSIEDEFVWPDLEKEDKQEDGYCYGLRDHIAILVDGTIIPCCLDHKGSVKLGNIFIQSISDILNEDKTKNIITGFQNRKATEKLCKNCTFKNKC